jgi:membrane-bound metal-dependent hydrolase YbcI (DUF457 family)
VTAPTHIVIGIAASVFTASHFSILLNPVGFLSLLFGALLPDVDGGGVITRPGTILKRFLNRPLVLLLDFFGASFSEISRKVTGHRGFFHWLIWPVLIIGFAKKFSILWLFWLGLGYLSHVIADALTPLGVPLLAPFSRRKISLSSIKTGSLLEFIVFLLSLLYSLSFCWELLPQGVQAAFSKLLVALQYE